MRNETLTRRNFLLGSAVATGALAGEKRPPEWGRILSEHKGRTVTFDYL